MRFALPRPLWIREKSGTFDEDKVNRDHGQFSEKPGAKGEETKPEAKPSDSSTIPDSEEVLAKLPGGDVGYEQLKTLTPTVLRKRKAEIKRLSEHFDVLYGQAREEDFHGEAARQYGRILITLSDEARLAASALKAVQPKRKTLALQVRDLQDGTVKPGMKVIPIAQARAGRVGNPLVGEVIEIGKYGSVTVRWPAGHTSTVRIEKLARAGDAKDQLDKGHYARQIDLFVEKPPPREKAFDPPDEADPTALVIAAVLDALGVGSDETREKAFDESKVNRDHGQFSSQPGAKGEGDKAHGVMLPKNRKKLTLGHATAALREMGYELGDSQFSHDTKTTLYTVTFPNGKRADLTVDKVKDLVYAGQRKADAPAPSPTPRRQPAGRKTKTDVPPGHLHVRDVAELAKLLKISEAEARKLAGEPDPEPSPPPPPPKPTIPVANRLAPVIARQALPIAKRIQGNRRAKVLLVRPSAWAERAAKQHAGAVAKKLGYSEPDANGLLAHLIQRMAGAVLQASRSGQRVQATARIAGRTLRVRRKGFLPPCPATWIREKAAHRFASTQVNLPGDLAEIVLRYGRIVRDEDLADDGREVEPHVTVRYGLHGGEVTSADVAALVAGFGPIRYRLGAVGVFPGEASGRDYDVLIVEVDSPDLHRLNRRLGDLPHTDTFPVYKPHCTIAYVQAGLGGAYAAAMPALDLVGHADRLQFSDTEGRPVEVDLLPRPPWSLAAAAEPVLKRLKGFDESKVYRDEGRFSEKPGVGGQQEHHPTTDAVNKPLAGPTYKRVQEALAAFAEAPTRAAAVAALDPRPIIEADRRNRREWVNRSVTQFLEGDHGLLDGLETGTQKAIRRELSRVLTESVNDTQPDLSGLKNAVRKLRLGSQRSEVQADVEEALHSVLDSEPHPIDAVSLASDALSDLIGNDTSTPQLPDGASDDEADALDKKVGQRARAIAEAFARSIKPAPDDGSDDSAA